MASDKFIIKVVLHDAWVDNNMVHALIEFDHDKKLVLISRELNEKN